MRLITHLAARRYVIPAHVTERGRLRRCVWPWPAAQLFQAPEEIQGKPAWLTDAEYEKLERIRLVRNPVTHFRAPLSEDSIEFRALSKADHPYIVIEQDARDVIEAVMHMLGRNAV